MLPKISHPIFDTTLPVTKQKIKFRPLLVKEEKLLLLAKEAQDLEVMIDALKQIISNVSLTEIDLDNLPIIDLQWIFIQLRIRSIGGTIRCNVTDPEDKKDYTVEIDLNNIKVTVDTPNPIVKLSDGLALKMKLPSIKDIHEVAKFTNSFATLTFDLILSCIVSVFDTEQEYPNFTKEELSEFIDSLDQTQVAKLVEFFANAPKLVLKYSYTNAAGQLKEWEVEKFNDFFI